MKRIAFIVIITLFFPIFIFQAYGGTAIKINYATVDLSLETISLNGINFDVGPLNIRIGDTFLAECPIVTPTLIECSLADTPALSGGTWRVSISAGNAPAKNAEIDVFIPVGLSALCNNGDFVDCYSGDSATQDVGECQPGIRACSSDGTWGACVGEVLPQTEICGDNLDNDCDGLIDNGCGPPPECTSGQSEPCYSGPSGTQDVGECQSGIRACSSDGTWGACVGQVLPSEEVCDGLDNDCDFQTDEGGAISSCDDGNPCTDVFCNGGVCENPAKQSGTPCPDDGLCDGEGNCVAS